MHELIRRLVAAIVWHPQEMNMDYREWLPMIGLAATDPRVVAALAAHGVTAPVTLGPQELETGLDFKSDGMSLTFNSEYDVRGGVADLPILSQIVMMIVLGKTAKNWTAYTGPLPFGLKSTDSRDDVIARIGQPIVADDDFCSARWMIDGQDLGIRFTPEWKQIKQLGVGLP
jgi:hypothetical protein